MFVSKDGITGDKLIHKRRGFAEPEIGASSNNKKSILFVTDCSASMYRFNGWDERLNRSLEAMALIMECFVGMESIYDYSIVAHSGDSDCIPLVPFGNPPENDLERMRILQSMVAHTQYCQSGDNTLQSIARAMQDVSSRTRNDGSSNTDESFVICISDANLHRYGIRPSHLNAVMRGQSLPTSSNIPKTFCIFVASFGDEADEIRRELPIGR